MNFVALTLFFCTAIPFLFSTALAKSKKQLPARPFDLNAATLKQLEELPGVGPVTAHAILNFREKTGPFKSVNDLLVIPRISKKKLDKIRPYVFVKPPAKSTASPAAPPKKSAPAKSSAAPAKKSAPQKNQTVRLSSELQLPAFS
jgi:competence ComEA-like helix-hairpin-helix protein